MKRLITWFIVGCGLFGGVATASDATDADRKRREILEMLKQLTPEELSEVETFNPEGGLAARRIRKLAKTDAALFVLSGEEIRRAGITHLGEALRLVPGLQVARIRPYRWAISARGLNEEFASKLLVMIDGRTVYSALRSEVNWETQDLIMDDVDRIEVIRGPGASLWGANAVNGIINIVTKPAADTQGNLLKAAVGGGETRALAAIRHGGRLGQRGHYRAYAKHTEHEPFVNPEGAELENDWNLSQGGFRADWQGASGDAYRVQGDVYRGEANNKSLLFLPTSTMPIEIDQVYELGGFNLLGRWQRDTADGESVVQAYYDQLQRKEFYFDEFRGTLDLDFQHRNRLSERWEFLWGAGYRFMYDDLPSKPEVSATRIGYTPRKRRDSLYSAFLQGEFHPAERWRLSLGAKFEHNDYTGFEWQPSARVFHQFGDADQHGLWASWSRAVRTPSRSEEGLRLSNPTPEFVFNLSGNADLESEELLAHEIGYRFTLPNRLLFDASLFYNEYEHLRTFEPTEFQPFPPPPTAYNLLENNMFGEVYGMELAFHWQAREHWRLRLNYSYAQVHLHLRDSMDSFSESLEGNTPHHQAVVHSMWDLSPDWTFDLMAFYTDNVPSQGVSAYTRVDARLAWTPWRELELSLGGRNLFDPYHLEFQGGQSGRTTYEVPRAWYVQARWNW